ncbi:hypothetical protein COM04_26795 [Bacillus wiedmannii]|uniref:hypothetical protein n=1 Tax=Bacillus TaxID=1386 RepID=UPI0002E1AB6E|nr:MULTISPECIES: hypothetical protein [Bacillus cereus group]KAA0783248.1 hypothetical protein DN394_27945 [Bacillus sp. BB081]MCC2379529.1 hypothetical protein [Bacillus wiedmannii]MCC2423442.1 hypothetical protein [Bacillus wiedmannii]PEP72046.1 hypothetical protein CN573_22155 [Bacillus wiedmannii]PGB90181.1 hypothetical protein COM04_26795 [Bacillus wiedmannii]
MSDEILKVVNKLYKQGDFQYLLGKFVDKHFLDGEINKIPNISVDNITDFSYSTCFSYILLPLDVKFRFGSVEFSEYVRKQSEINYVMLMISAIAPYAVVKYFRCRYTNGTIDLVEESSPYNDESKKIESSILKLLDSHGIKNLDKETLSIEVEDVSLELKETGVTIYNCLFEDEY